MACGAGDARDVVFNVYVCVCVVELVYNFFSSKWSGRGAARSSTRLALLFLLFYFQPTCSSFFSCAIRACWAHSCISHHICFFTAAIMCARACRARFLWCVERGGGVWCLGLRTLSAEWWCMERGAGVAMAMRHERRRAGAVGRLRRTGVACW